MGVREFWSPGGLGLFEQPAAGLTGLAAGIGIGLATEAAQVIAKINTRTRSFRACASIGANDVYVRERSRAQCQASGFKIPSPNCTVAGVMEYWSNGGARLPKDLSYLPKRSVSRRYFVREAEARAEPRRWVAPPNRCTNPSHYLFSTQSLPCPTLGSARELA